MKKLLLALLSVLSINNAFATQDITCVASNNTVLIYDKSHSVSLQLKSNTEAVASLGICNLAVQATSCDFFQLAQDEYVEYGEYGSGGVYYINMGRDRWALNVSPVYHELEQGGTYYSSSACENGRLLAIRTIVKGTF